MDIIRLLYTLILLASLICAFFLIRYARKRKEMPGARFFILLVFTASIYNVGYIGEINSASKEWALFWFHFEHIAIPFEHYLWVMMSLEYARVNRKFLQTAKYTLLYHPALYCILYFTNGLHHLYISRFDFVSNGFFHVLQTVKGPAYALIVVSGTLLAIISIGAYIRAYVRSSRLHRNEYMIMIVASLFPWVAVYLTVSPGNSLGIDYFPLFSSLSGLFYVVGIFQYKLFQIVPIATDMVFRHSKEGIMLIDQSDRIIEANLFMTKMYPELCDLKQRIGFASFTEAHPELSDFVAGERTAQYELMNEGSERHYLAHMTLIKAEGDLAVGKMLTISEITQFMEQQKQLESIASHALNKAETNEISFLQAQIKPHFLNNTLSVISSMITSDPGKAKALIADLGEYLVRSCYFDSSTDMVLLQEELETVNIYVAIQCARFGPRIVFELDCPHTPNMLIPRLVLQPLVENAIRHGILKKAQGGKVTLRIITDSGSVSFVVIDDGIGISADKAALLMAQHSRQDGVGLPNIHKRLIKHYGEGLQIDSMLGSGTKVFFRIPYQKVMHEEAEHGQRNRCG